MRGSVLLLLLHLLPLCRIETATSRLRVKPAPLTEKKLGYRNGRKTRALEAQLLAILEIPGAHGRQGTTSLIALHVPVNNFEGRAGPDKITIITLSRRVSIEILAGFLPDAWRTWRLFAADGETQLPSTLPAVAHFVVHPHKMLRFCPFARALLECAACPT